MGLTRKITFRKAIPYALVKEVPEFLPSSGPTALAVRPEDFAALNKALQTCPARAPAATEFSCSGWVEPITHPKPIDREDPTLLDEDEGPFLVDLAQLAALDLSDPLIQLSADHLGRLSGSLRSRAASCARSTRKSGTS